MGLDLRRGTPAAFVSMGVYAGGTTYAINNWVTYGGSSWVSLVNNNVGNTPVEGANWTRLASDGLTTSRIIHGPVAAPAAGQAISGASFTDVTNFVAVPNVATPIEIVLEGDVRVSTLTGWVAATLVPVVRLISDRYRALSDIVLNSTTTITSATAAFTSADVGEPIYTTAAGSILPGTVIASVTNSTTAILSIAATATGSGVAVAIGVIELFALRMYMPVWVSNTNPATEVPANWVWRLTPSNAARTYKVQAHGGNANGTITFLGSNTTAGLGARLLTRLP